MYLVSVEELKPGQILGQSLYNERSELLLAAGYRIDTSVISQLKKNGYQSVFITDQYTKYVLPQEIISNTLRLTANKQVVETYEQIRKKVDPSRRKVLQNLDPTGLKDRLRKDKMIRNMIGIYNIKKIVGDIVEEIIDNNVSFIAQLPLKSTSAREYQHAVDTTILSIVLGRFFDYQYKDLLALGTASLLHDIGKSVIPETRNVDSEGSAKDMEQFYREHPTYSMLLLRGSYPGSFKEQFTVHHHHEHLDGTGFPQGLTGLDSSPARKIRSNDSLIYQHAYILSVVNEYDILVSGLSGDAPLTPEAALHKLVKNAGTHWNSYVVQALIKLVDRYPVGMRVRIKRATTKKLQGYIGVVGKRNPNDPARPLLLLTHNALGNRIRPMKVDLSKEETIDIELFVPDVT